MQMPLKQFQDLLLAHQISERMYVKTISPGTKLGTNQLEVQTLKVTCFDSISPR